MAALNFDANTVEPNEAYDPLPPGWYVAMITESEIKQTNNQQGNYLNLQFKIVQGGLPQHTNRVVFDRLNINNPNPTAVEIAQKDLSAICRAVGVMNLSDSQQLHGIPLGIKLKVRQDEGYDATNEIRGYKVAAEITPEQLAATAVATPAAANAAPVPAQPAAPAAPAQPAAAPAATPAAAPAQPAAPAATPPAAAAPAGVPPAAAAPAGGQPWTQPPAVDPTAAAAAPPAAATPAEPATPPADVAAAAPPWAAQQ